jgi:hypothetical protein
MPGTLLVPLTRGYFAVIDEADGDAVGRWNWSASISSDNRVIYAKRTVKTATSSRSLPLHGFLWRHWGMPACPQVDHRDSDGLNNRRENLRAATGGQNSGNTRAHKDSASGIKGVRMHPRAHRWEARICSHGESRHLGLFDTAEEAAAAYAAAARAAFGEFARLA